MQESGESGRGEQKVFTWHWGREEPPAHSPAVHRGAGRPGAGACGVGPGDRSLGARLQAGPPAAGVREASENDKNEKRTGQPLSKRAGRARECRGIHVCIVVCVVKCILLLTAPIRRTSCSKVVSAKWD